MSRRRILAAAGLATVGLAAGGWAYASSRSGGPPATRPLWARKTGGPVSSGAALDNGILYIGSGDGQVYAFEAASGRPVRTFRTSGAVSGGVTVTGGMLFAGSADHHVYAFHAGTGDRAWAYPTGGPVDGTPTVAGGTVYIGSDDGYLYAIDAGTGHLVWRYPTGGPVRSGPQLGSQVFDGTVYVASGSGHLYGLGTAGKTAGQLQWRFATSGPVIAGLVYDQGEVCVGDTNGHLFLLNGDGPLVEKPIETSAGGAVRGRPAVAGNTIFFGTAAPAVRAAAIYGGRAFWSYPTSGPVNSGPAADSDGSTVYAGDDHGYVYAIDATSITSRWTYQAGAAVQSQLLLANGVVYFGSLDHHVYALPA